MKTLQDYREQIDALDRLIIDLLRQRFEIVQNVGHYKTKNKLEIVQTNRVQEVLQHARDLANTHDLDPDFVARLYQLMIDHAHTLEEGIKKTYETMG